MVVIECLKLAKPLPQPKIVDIGTGSGNLAIAVAKHLAGARVMAIDKSADALALAGKNAARHEVQERVRFLQGDLFAPLAGDEKFDFVLSNPPYIPSADIPGLPIGVRNFEPHLALDGGADGFAVFDRLVTEASGRLVEGGYLLVEIGAPQEGPARQRMGQIAELELLPTIYDYSRHPRVLAGRKRK
jgi:release factor glutamine methyltransferase